MSDDLRSDEPVPWILTHAAERRGDGATTTGTVDEAPAEEAPVSKFRRVSGATVRPAAASVRPPAARTYTPPPPLPPRDWDDKVDTFRPSPRAHTPPPLPPPPSRRHSTPGSSPYAPTSTKWIGGGGAIAAIVAGVLVVGGAGAGGLLLATRGGNPSRAEFVATADDACRSANRPIAAIVKPTTYPELATAAGTVTVAIDSQLARLRSLKQPRGSTETEVAAVFTSLETTGAAADRLRDAAGRQDDVATVAATNDMASAFGEARTKATAAGFAACSVGMQAGVDAVSGGAQSVMKAGFVAQADALCRRAADDIHDAAITVISHANDVFDQLMIDIKALPVPPGDEALLAELLADQDKVQETSREFEHAAADEDFDRLGALDRELSARTTAADAKWDAYGLGSCGSNFGL